MLGPEGVVEDEKVESAVVEVGVVAVVAVDDSEVAIAKGVDGVFEEVKEDGVDDD